MKLNNFGLYEERVKNKHKFNFENVSKVSPNFNRKYNESTIGKELFSHISGINHSKKLGYYLTNYIGYVNEGNIREKASSGGFGTWLLLELLENNHIDGVIHVKHVKSDTEDKLFAYEISK